MLSKISLKKWGLVIIILILLTVITNFLTGAPSPVASEFHGGEEDYYRGKVLEVETQTTEQGYWQEAEVEITDGPYQGEITQIESQYEEGNRFLDIKLEEDLEIVLVSFVENEERKFHLQDIARDNTLLRMANLLGLALLIVGGVKGLKTIITLFITGYILVQVLFPLLLQGYSPIPVATLTALVMIGLILLVIGGLNGKTAAAIVGTGIGVGVAGILAYYAGNAAELSGLGTQEAQMLAVGAQTIDVRGLLFAGIIIGSLGAVTDVGMSVASSAYQLKEASTNISSAELISHAMAVGRDIMGTMANTLILAYVGGAIPLILLIMAQEMSWVRIINMDFLATEIISGIAGTLGLIIAIPVTAVIAGMFFGHR